MSGANLKVSGDLGQILENSLKDADYMYHNDGRRVSDKYGISEKQALYNWWKALKALDFALKKQKRSLSLSQVTTHRLVEPCACRFTAASA